MLGSRIASLRRSAGMGQAVLAEQLNISTSTLGMYEQGRREPPLDILIALSREFGVTTDYLITGQIGSMRDFLAQADMLAYNRRNSMQSSFFSREELAVLIAMQLIKH